MLAYRYLDDFDGLELSSRELRDFIKLGQITIQTSLWIKKEIKRILISLKFLVNIDIYIKTMLK